MLATVFARISNCLSILCQCMWTFWTFCQFLQRTRRIYRPNSTNLANQEELWRQMVSIMGRFYRGYMATWSMALVNQKRTLATRLTTVWKCLRLFCKRLRLFCKRLQLFAEKLIRIFFYMFKISLRQEKLFATIKTVCELVCNLLRNLTSWRIQNSVRSQAIAAQCDTPLISALS